MTQRDETDSEPAAGGLWNLTLRFDEIPGLRAALNSTDTLTVDEAEVADRLLERLDHLERAIRQQAGWRHP